MGPLDRRVVRDERKQLSGPQTRPAPPSHVSATLIGMDRLVPADRDLYTLVRRGAATYAALRREFEPALWRRDAVAQTVALIAGRRQGRHHAGLVPERYESRRGDPAIWIRPGSGDSAVWGEINVFGTYAAPWPLADAIRLLDLGAHVGYFGRWALRSWPVKTLTSVEPDPDNLELLRRNRAALGDPRWHTIEAAASTANGVCRFAGARGAGSHLSGAGEVEVRTIDSLLLLADCDLAKIDIEGGEWPILRDDRFATCGPGMLVLEFHAEPGMREPDVEACRLVKRAGYEIVSQHRETDAVGVIWARRGQ
jgi:FkbM family methyltransferase